MMCQGAGPALCAITAAICDSAELGALVEAPAIVVIGAPVFSDDNSSGKRYSFKMQRQCSSTVSTILNPVSPRSFSSFAHCSACCGDSSRAPINKPQSAVLEKALLKQIQQAIDKA